MSMLMNSIATSTNWNQRTLLIKTQSFVFLSPYGVLKEGFFFISNEPQILFKLDFSVASPSALFKLEYDILWL